MIGGKAKRETSQVDLAGVYGNYGVGRFMNISFSLNGVR